MRGGGNLAAARCRRQRSPACGAHILVLQSFNRGNLTLDSLHRQLPRRPGPARRGTSEHRPSRRRSDRVCRRARTGDRRLHPSHVRRSSQARPHRHDRLVPRRHSRASIDGSSFPKRRSCWRRSISDICATRRLEKTRPLSRSSTIFRNSSMTFCSCCRDQTGVHGDGVRAARQILASRARGRSSRDFRTG